MQKKIMKFFYKKYYLFLAFLILFANNVFADDSLRGLTGFEWQRIDAVKNARNHSNMGYIYFKEGNYGNALREYQIAYNLTYNLNSASTYLYNIANCFLKLNNYKAAQSAIEGAIEKNCMNITYYKTLVDVYIKQNKEQKELERLLKDGSNPYNRIIAGLIFVKTGRKREAKGIFDEFVNLYPDMIITNDVRTMLNSI